MPELREKTDRRARLLEAGAEVFSSKPYTEVSVQEIAAHAGVAHGLLFHYFESKRRFYFAVLEQMSESSLARFDANSTPDPGRWLTKELDLFLDLVAVEAPMFTVTVHGSLGVEAETQEIVSRQLTAATDRILTKLAAERRSPLLVAAVRAWVASANELAAQWLEGGGALPKRHVRRVLIGSLNAALRQVAAVDRTARFDPERFASAR